MHTPILGICFALLGARLGYLLWVMHKELAKSSPSEEEFRDAHFESLDPDTPFASQEEAQEYMRWLSKKLNGEWRE